MKRVILRHHHINLFPALLALLLVISSTACRQESVSQAEPADLVSTLMGTDSEYLLSHGNTYPAVALPFGMNFWTPQTRKNGDGWGYTYDDHKIVGIKQTHQPSPWINDYAAFSLMPVTGSNWLTVERRASWFSHKAEVARPYYYSVYLADYDITAEVTPTERAAIFRFTFPQSDSSAVVIDAFAGGSMVKIIPGENRVEGYCRNNHGGVPENFHNYFVIEFDRPFDFWSVALDGTEEPGATEREGDHAQGVIGFRTQRGEKVTARVASSFISPEQAILNLSRETGAHSFDFIRDAARERWNSELGRIRVEGGSDDQVRTFYSTLYRTMLFPRMFHESDSAGNIIHYSPYNGQVLPGRLYTDNGFWDTFRAAMPLLTLMYPEMSSHIMEGLVNAYLESGWLPEWASPGHRNCMIGSNSASLIADAYLKGIRGYNIDTLWNAMVKNTRGHGPVHSVGRYGAEYYNDLGYVPYDAGINENVARTLEYAYADWCLWKLAQELGRPQEEIDLYGARALNYRNVFDPTSKLMRGRNLDGTFQSPFSPYKWGDAFTEGNSWHYTWSVFQDVAGLAGLMGGKEEMIRMLDSVFVVPPLFDDSYYGFPIHEIREMQIMNMGNYAHGNQPVQHMIYLYNYTPQPWKAQMRVREVMDKLYNYTPDGYCGDEDNGQTSAWYVFSALGFYPVTPGTGEYVLGSPLFSKVTVTLSDGKELVISAPENSRDNIYVNGVRLNGRPLDVNYITHEQLTSGGRLQFTMGTEPDKVRGISPSAWPYSMSTHEKVKESPRQDTMSTLSFSGIFPPLPTAFDNDENLLPDKIRFNIEKLSRFDLAGFLILGSNGEQVMLSEKEKIEAITAAREALPEDRLLLAGTGCQSTRETISLTRAAAAAGAHAMLVLNPFYYKGNMNQNELVRHYYDVADASPVPVLVYNMPGNTGLDMSARMIIDMAKHPNIVGLKESGGNMVKMGEVLGNVKPGFQVLAGGAGFLLPALAVGAVGGILASANIAPAHCIEIFRAFAAGDINLARELQHRIIPLNTAVTSCWGVPALKVAMDLLGLYGGNVRRPLLPMDEVNREYLKEVMLNESVILYDKNK